MSLTAANVTSVRRVSGQWAPRRVNPTGPTAAASHDGNFHVFSALLLSPVKKKIRPPALHVAALPSAPRATQQNRQWHVGPDAPAPACKRANRPVGSRGGSGGENVPCALRCSSPALRRCACACACEWRAHLYIINRSPTAGPRCRPKIQFRPRHRRRRRRGAARDRAAPPEASRTAETNRPEEEAIRTSPIALSPSYLPVSLGPNSVRRQPPFSSVRIRSSVLAICSGDSAAVLYQTSLLYCIIIIL